VSSNRPNGAAFKDFYEVLQLSPNADEDTLTRVYHVLVKRYHSDNQATANEAKFAEVVEAYRLLSDPDKRLAYDVVYEENRANMLKIFEGASSTDTFDSDRRILDGILSLLYVARRRDPDKAGMGPVQLERMLGCPSEHLEFHLWYLLEKNWIVRLSNGLFAITVAGIDRMIEQDALSLRRSRLLTESASPDAPADEVKKLR